MRVISGIAKGIRLRSPPGDVTRPIADRVKESLFNILSDDVIDSTFLDLFAGTGGVGIEALSRGAQSAVFVEQNRRVVGVLRENLRVTGLTARATVVCRDVFKFIKRTNQTNYDFIYVAPPQYRGLWAKTLRALDGRRLLKENGTIIVQIYPKEFAALPLRSLVLVDQRKYGSTLLCFYRRVDAKRSEDDDEEIITSQFVDSDSDDGRLRARDTKSARATKVNPLRAGQGRPAGSVGTSDGCGK